MRTVTIRLPDDLIAALDNDAKNEATKRAAIVRRIIKQHYDERVEQLRQAKNEWYQTCDNCQKACAGIDGGWCSRWSGAAGLLPQAGSVSQ